MSGRRLCVAAVAVFTQSQCLLELLFVLDFHPEQM